MSAVDYAELVAELRGWPSVLQGDALSASTVAEIMERAADRIESLQQRLAEAEGALPELRRRTLPKPVTEYGRGWNCGLEEAEELIRSALSTEKGEGPGA